MSADEPGGRSSDVVDCRGGEAGSGRVSAMEGVSGAARGSLDVSRARFLQGRDSRQRPICVGACSVDQHMVVIGAEPKRSRNYRGKGMRMTEI